MKKGLVGFAVVIAGLILVGAAVTPNSFLRRSLPSPRATQSSAGQLQAKAASTAGLDPSGSGGSAQAISGGPAVPALTTTVTDATPATQGPLVIRTAQITLGVKSGQFQSTFDNVRSYVEAEGGFISGSDAQQVDPASQDGLHDGVVSFQVPADKFETVLDGLFGMGTVQSTHIAGVDVSNQYVDLKARLANAESQRDAYLLLMQQAKTVQDIIAVQQQLAQVTGQIEQLKGQIANIDSQTAYATVSVTIHELGAVAAPQQPADDWGFKTALSDAAHNFVATINLAVAGLGAAGPFIIVAGLGWVLWRRREWLGLGAAA